MGCQSPCLDRMCSLKPLGCVGSNSILSFDDLKEIPRNVAHAAAINSNVMRNEV